MLCIFCVNDKLPRLHSIEAILMFQVALYQQRQYLWKILIKFDRLVFDRNMLLANAKYRIIKIYEDLPRPVKRPNVIIVRQKLKKWLDATMSKTKQLK